MIMKSKRHAPIRGSLKQVRVRRTIMSLNIQAYHMKVMDSDLYDKFRTGEVEMLVDLQYFEITSPWQATENRVLCAPFVDKLKADGTKRSRHGWAACNDHHYGCSTEAQAKSRILL